MFEDVGLAGGERDHVGGTLSEEPKVVRVLDERVFGTLEPGFEGTDVAVGGIGEADEFGIG